MIGRHQSALHQQARKRRRVVVLKLERLYQLRQNPDQLAGRQESNLLHGVLPYSRVAKAFVQQIQRVRGVWKLLVVLLENPKGSHPSGL